MGDDIIPGFPELPWLPAQLSAATIKYGWAATHIHKLNEVLRAFEDSQPWKPEQTGELPAGMVRIRIQKEPPQEIGLILGDIVHSLRASLDYATCSLVKISDSESDIRNVQFPFGRPGVPLNSAERARLGSVRETALPYIEAARQAGHPYLDVLNRVSNQDKHRLILPVMLRRMPMRIEINAEANTADFVPDIEREDIWAAPLVDGDIIEMGNILALRPGFHIDGDPAPYSLRVIMQMFIVTHMALSYMIEAAAKMLALKRAQSAVSPL